MSTQVYVTAWVILLLWTLVAVLWGWRAWRTHDSLYVWQVGPALVGCSPLVLLSVWILTR